MAGELVEVHRERREGRREETAEREAVDADHAHVARHVDARATAGREHAERAHVVEGDDRVGRARTGDDPLGRDGCGLRGRRGREDDGHVHRPRLERAHEQCGARAGARGDGRVEHDGVAHADRVEVVGERVDRLRGIQLHGGTERGGVRIQLDDRHRAEPRDPLGGPRPEGPDHGVGLRAERLHHAVGVGGEADVGERHVPAAGRSDPHHGGRELGRPRVPQGVHHDAELVVATRHEPATEPRRAVRELIRGVEHAPLRLLADARHAVHRARHGLTGDPGGGRDFVDRGAAGRAITRARAGARTRAPAARARSAQPRRSSHATCSGVSSTDRPRIEERTSVMVRGPKSGKVGNGCAST